MMNNIQNIIYAISFTDLFAVGLISPLLGNHLRNLGVSHFIIGLLGSSYSGVQVISGPLVGSWSDVRDRKTVLKTTLLLCAICYLLLGFVNWIVAIFIIRIFLGCLKHTQGSCKAMISDLFPPDKQAEMLSCAAVLGTIGFNIGPLIGGYIVELPNGFTYICCLVFLLFMFNIILSSFLPSFKGTKIIFERKPSKTRGVKQELTKVSTNIMKIEWSKNWQLFAIRFLFGISISFFFYNEPFYLKSSFNLNQRQMGYLMSFRGVVQTCTIFSLGYVKKIFYKNDSNCLKRIFHSFLIMSVTSFLLYFIDNLAFYVVCMIPLIMTSSVLRISTMELLLGTCKKDQIGTFSGVSNSIMSVARSITPVMSGLVTDMSSSQISLFLSSIPAMMGTFLTLILSNKLQNSDKKID